MAGLIWLASYPKSGNTWLRAFIHNLMRDERVPYDINRLDDLVASGSSRKWYDAAHGRQNRRRQIRFDAGVSDFLLTPSLKSELELLMTTLAPGATSGKQPYSHDGEEAGIVMSGQLEIWIDGKSFLLGQGDSFAFKSTLPHRYQNPGTTEAVVIWAITPPSY